jgi:ABC-type multidrug transport system ATPase subunit
VSGPPAVVAAEDLEVRYHGGPEPAVRGVTLRLGAGEGLLVTGPPGAGKTSLLRALLGLVEHRGAATVHGAPPGAAGARGRTGYGPQGEGFAAGLRVGETVRAALAARGADDAAATAAAIERAGLSYVADWRTARLDAEGHRRLALALAIAGDPALVVLDDPWILSDTLREIAAARARGAAVLAAAARPGGLAPALGGRLALADGAPR